MMTSEGGGELSSMVGAVPAVLPRSTSVGARTLAPIILRATALEATGACMQVGGLRVIDRAIRLLARLGDAHVVIAADGSVPVPRRLPPNVECRDIEGDVTAGIEQLQAELGPHAMIVGADNVWLQPAGFEQGMRVVDPASRRAAAQEVFGDSQRETVGIIDRLFNQKIASRLTRLLLVHLPVSPALLTLIAGLVGVYGALLVAVGGWSSVLSGFVILEGFAILDGCASELGRVRLHQTAFGGWLDTVIGDFVNVAMILAVGLALWRHGGAYLDMKMALAAAAMTLFYVAVSYRELMRQGEGDVMKLRWWFAHGQPLKDVRGADSAPIRWVMLLGRRDLVIVLAIGLDCFDRLPMVLPYLMIIAFVRAAGALGQLLTPAWRIRLPL
jgi:hypothetical protein